ncbi:MAG: choice-of-anchor J domain-containing protein [Muribaculaceae bacterium]|nr:choice-of-anchor J domain-containing protein [Muribaculaceae bacterium]
MNRQVLFTVVVTAMLAVVARAESVMPVTLGLADEAAFASWTVIDGNAAVSPNTWTCGNAEAVYTEDRSNAADDWLISPAVTLEAGVTYAIDYYLVQKSTYFGDKQRYAITVGDAPTVQAQSTVLTTNDSFSSKLYTKQTVTFTPTASGDYYLGVHLYSDSYNGDCGFQKFEVSESTQPVDDTTGQPKTIPYNEDFSAAAHFEEFTTITNTTRGWTYSSSEQCAQFWGGSSPVDVWLITPSIAMQGGKTYKLTFRTGLENAVSTTSYKHLYVTMGQGNTAEAQTTALWDELIQSALMNKKEVYFTVPADGDYNVGFRVLDETSVYAIFVDDISIELSEVIPQVATQLTVTPDSEGQLKAEVNWVNPVKDLAGYPLETLTKVELYRGTDLLATYDNPQVGGTLSYTDETIPAAGQYTYAVVAYLAESTSDRAEVTSGWIGVDTPAAVTDVVLAEADGHLLLTWTAPARGKNGGYIDVSALAYRIERHPDEVTVADHLNAVSYTDAEDLPLNNYSYTVYAVIGDQQSEGAVSNALVHGSALELPYEARMNDANEIALWTIVDANADDNTWKYNASDRQFAYTSYKPADDYLFTPPFRTVAGKHQLTYSVKGYNYRYSDAFDVVLSASTDPATPMTVISGMEQNGVESAMLKQFIVEFDVPAAGIYHIGFHDVTTDAWGLYVGAVKVELLEAADTMAGDLNGDGNVDVSDVNLLINVVLGKATAADLTGQADLNGDGICDVSDVNALINIILKK